MQQTFNSSIKLDNSFFKERGLHRGETIQDIEDKHSMLVVNVNRGEISSPKKGKGSKSPNKDTKIKKFR